MTFVQSFVPSNGVSYKPPVLSTVSACENVYRRTARTSEDKSVSTIGQRNGQKLLPEAVPVSSRTKDVSFSPVKVRRSRTADGRQPPPPLLLLVCSHHFAGLRSICEIFFSKAKNMSPINRKTKQLYAYMIAPLVICQNPVVFY